MAFEGTTLQAPLVSVVDGDTIKVQLPSGEENIRILALDTEEKPGSGGSKPKTPFGEAATQRAAQFFDGATDVTLELPGTEPVDEALAKYRGNFGRVLAFVYRGNQDFQETMIEEGFSPYFTKYGNAQFSSNHQRYRQAERAAQMTHAGVWNQELVNGSERRNYAVLSTWWNLRAEIIDRYRALKQAGRPILNTRLDYDTIATKAAQGATVTVFTEVSRVTTINNDAVGFADIGSQAQPFTLFLPGLAANAGRQVLDLLRHRYVSTGSDSDHPRRSYLYVTGALSQHQGEPQMVVTSVDQITDEFPGPVIQPTPPTGSVRIVALLPNPVGQDAGSETVTLRNDSGNVVDLTNWTLRDRSGNAMPLGGSIAPGATLEITAANRLSLNNDGDEIALLDGQSAERSKVDYDGSEVQSGQPLFF